MATLQTLRDRSGRWEVDRVFDRTDVDYLIRDRGVLVGEVRGREALTAWLSRVGVDLADLKPIRGGYQPWAKL